MDADSPLDPRFLPDAVKGAENRGLSDEGLLPSHHKRGERCPLQQQVPFLRSTFFFAHMQAEAEGARITWVAQPSPSPMAFGVPSLG